MNSAQEIERDLMSQTVTILRLARSVIKNHQDELRRLGETGKKQQSQFRNVINVAIDATDVETIQAYILYRGTRSSGVWSILSVPVCRKLKELLDDTDDMKKKLARARLFFGYLDWAYSIWSKGDSEMKKAFWGNAQEM